MAHSKLVYLEGFAKGRSYNELLLAINLADKLHKGQTRLSGEPYIEHPLEVAIELIALGVTDEATLVAALLHDTIEDCGVSDTQLAYDYHISSEAISVVLRVTKYKGGDLEAHFRTILDDVRSVLLKLADRGHNVSTMQEFSLRRMKNYVAETETFIIPMAKQARRLYPEYSNQIYILKKHIENMLVFAKVLTVCLEEQQNSHLWRD